MPHECTSCGRTFDDGSKEMLSGCPDCGGNKFQFHPGEDESRAPPSEPPEPPEPPGRSTVAETVGKTAATVRDLVGGGPSAGGGTDEADAASTDSSRAGAAASDRSGVTATAGRAGDGPDRPPATGDRSLEREDTAQASARSEVVAPDELPSEAPSETEHRFDPVDAASDAEDATTPAPAGDVEDGDRPARGSAESPASAASPANAESPASAASPANTDAEASSADGADRPDLEELRAELNDQFESVKVCRPGEYELNLMGLYDREEYIVALQEDGRYSIQVPEAIGD